MGWGMNGGEGGGELTFDISVLVVPVFMHIIWESFMCLGQSLKEK